MLGHLLVGWVGGVGLGGGDRRRYMGWALGAYFLSSMYEFSSNQEPKSLGRWVAKLVADLLGISEKYEMGYISKGVGNVREPPVHK